MFDVVLPVKAVLLGGITAAAVMLLAIRRTPRPVRGDASWSWAIAVGLLAAAVATDHWPRWPPLEDRARFLLLLVPLTVAVETLAAGLRSARRRSTLAVWAMRLAVSAATAPIVLYHSVYLADLDHRGSPEWSNGQAAIVLFGLAASLSLLWATMSLLEARTSTAAVMGLLMIDALAVGTTVMLSGYFRAGLMGLGLAGAIGGAALGSCATRSPAASHGNSGMAVVGLFAVVLMGRFFGALPSVPAVCLLLAPLLSWLVELPGPRALAPTWRAAARLACVALPLLIVLFVAQQKFVAATSARPGLNARSPDGR